MYISIYFDMFLQFSRHGLGMAIPTKLDDWSKVACGVDTGRQFFSQRPAYKIGKGLRTTSEPPEVLPVSSNNNDNRLQERDDTKKVPIPSRSPEAEPMFCPEAVPSSNGRHYKLMVKSLSS